MLHGAQQVECTINGIGERAGNAALEEVVMALKTRRDLYQAVTNVDTTQLSAASSLLCKITGQKMPANKAIVGKNAFAHGSGIHQHGMLAERSMYEIMRPEEVGMGATTIYLSKHSGRHGLANRLHALNIQMPPEQMDQLFAKFKLLAAKKKQIEDVDLIKLAAEIQANQRASAQH